MNEEPLSIIFTSNPNNNVEDLKQIFEVFMDTNAKFVHLESRKRMKNVLEIFIQTNVPINRKDDIIERLAKCSNNAKVCSEEWKILDLDKKHIPWFPKHASDLDHVSNNVLVYGKELDADHPGFKDSEYRIRRAMFYDVACNYKYDQPIPIIEYSEVEKQTWTVIYRKLTSLYKRYACEEYNKNLKLLQQHANYDEFDIPQLQVISTFLKERTGFTLRPVAGYLSSRDFLSGLALRVFYCTQYIRHHKDPLYTPEPDCCHEILGHVPMLADATFANFSQEIGLASLGVSDDEMKKFATCYFFTIEFGLCRQNNELKVYGAGLLSSAAELEFAVSDKALVRPFIPTEVINEECLVTTFQNSYFETPSFVVATELMRNFAKQIKRPFDVYYNKYSEHVEIIRGPSCIVDLINSVENNLSTIKIELEKMNKNWINSNKSDVIEFDQRISEN